MLGTAVYQVARWVLTRRRNPSGLKRPGMTTVPPEASVARTDANNPWMWNSGMTHTFTSVGPSAYVPTMLSADATRLRWRIGARFGRPVVPLLWRIKATSSGLGSVAVRPDWLGVVLARCRSPLGSSVASMSG